MRALLVDLEAVAGEYGCGKMEDLHAALGFGKFSARQILQKLAPDRVQQSEAAVQAPKPAPAAPGQPDGNGDLVIKVKGIDDLLVYRAKCCNPIKGEAIVGYVTRGKGVGVHSINCTNVQNLMYEAERKIDVEWARAASPNFPVKVVVYTDDRPGMLNQLTSVLFAEQCNIRSLEARGLGDTEDLRGARRGACALTSAMVSDPEHIAISKSKGIKVDWKDGHRSEYTVGYLRDECPCASCTGAHGTEPRKTNHSAPQPASPFQMFQPALKMTSVEEVGHYAIRIPWSDGHNTGIYSFDHLRNICPCEECKAARG